MDLSKQGFKPWQAYMSAFLDPNISKYGNTNKIVKPEQGENKE